MDEEDDDEDERAYEPLYNQRHLNPKVRISVRNEIRSSQAID